MNGNTYKLGKFISDLDELEVKARHIRDTRPDRFSVKKLARELKCSNHNSNIVYYRILREK